MKTLFLLVVAIGVGVWLNYTGAVSVPSAVVMATDHGVPEVMKGKCVHVKDTSFYMCI